MKFQQIQVLQENIFVIIYVRDSGRRTEKCGGVRPVPSLGRVEKKIIAGRVG